MSKQLSQTFKNKLLEYAARGPKELELRVELAKLESHVRTYHSKTCSLCSEIVELWKKETEATHIICDYIKLPDGKVAVLQEGAITIWKLTELP
ncbi:MAG TPA: hypothetical protein VNU68_02005 [Verrucomicrobiae bacterium]|nr:hypothetical protein [Verrucomicrobiae bacterium]